MQPTMSGRALPRAAQVARAIELDILRDRTPVGARLGRRTDLIERHSVSPAVMGEALRLLRERGMVEVRSGPGGGVFVTGSPQQVQLGILDLWFAPGTPDPRGLFEARHHLEDLLTGVALERAGPDDVTDMERALDELGAASTPHDYLDANMRLHLTIVRAARIPIVAGTHEAVVAILRGSLMRVELLPGHEEHYAHNAEVHAEIIAALRDRDRDRLTKALALHRGDLTHDADRP